MAKSSTARVARKTAAKGTTPPVNQHAATNDAMNVLIADAVAAIDLFRKNDDANVRANQRVAYDLFQYREIQIADGIKPVTFETLRDPTKRSSWRTSMANTFIGKAPSTSGDKSQAKIDAAAEYKAKRRIFDDACDFIVAAGVRGVTSKHFNEALGCFAVPVVSLLPIDDKWEPMFDLRRARDAGESIPLANKAYTIAVGTDKSRVIRSSLKQVVSAFQSKAPTAKPGTSNGSTSNAENAGTRAEPTTSVDMPAWRASNKALPFTTFIPEFWNKLAEMEKTAPVDPDDYTTSEWNTLMNIAQRINAWIQLKADKAKAKAEADKAKPDNVVQMAKPAPRKGK